MGKGCVPYIVWQAAGHCVAFSGVCPVMEEKHLCISNALFIGTSSSAARCTFVYRVTHQVVPKLLIQGQCKSHSGLESRVWEQPDVSPCTSSSPLVTVKLTQLIITLVCFLAPL